MSECVFMIMYCICTSLSTITPCISVVLKAKEAFLEMLPEMRHLCGGRWRAEDTRETRREADESCRGEIKCMQCDLHSSRK